ncbi:hypothetical protein [Leadbettera azotonutricia]|uniref:hypothetical protein n=1 Tax=Leadbettera azotonutricia TaxID=150829 RepID=UPI0011D2097B|nr:hypothetical protein [Leadbettera azotonutricia]
MEHRDIHLNGIAIALRRCNIIGVFNLLSNRPIFPYHSAVFADSDYYPRCLRIYNICPVVWGIKKRAPQGIAQIYGQVPFIPGLGLFYAKKNTAGNSKKEHRK